jgi:hypothetical protein
MAEEEQPLQAFTKFFRSDHAMKAAAAPSRHCPSAKPSLKPTAATKTAQDKAPPSP